MIDPAPRLPEPTDSTAQCCAEIDATVRRNPGASILVALGVGLAAGVLVRALSSEPKKPQHRLAEFLEDLEDRLHEVGEPAIRAVSGYASDSAHAVSKSVSRGEAQLERLLREATRRLRGVWS